MQYSLDTKVKQVTHQNKTRKQTDHDSTPPLKGRLPGDPRHAKKERQIQIGWVEGSQEEGKNKKTGAEHGMTGWPGNWRADGQNGGMSGARPEKCNRAGQGASGGRPGGQAEACSGEDEVEGGPHLECLEDPEEEHSREGVGFRNRTGLGDQSQLRGWREMLNRMALDTQHPHSDSP